MLTDSYQASFVENDPIANYFVADLGLVATIDDYSIKSTSSVNLGETHSIMLLIQFDTPTPNTWLDVYKIVHSVDVGHICVFIYSRRNLLYLELGTQTTI